MLRREWFFLYGLQTIPELLDRAETGRRQAAVGVSDAGVEGGQAARLGVHGGEVLHQALGEFEGSFFRLAAQAALAKKAVDLVVLDVHAVSSVSDYFLVCSGKSSPHLTTIVDAIRQALKDHEIRPLHAEGAPESGWILLDYGDVLMHVFMEDTRAYYALERLWGDAPALVLEG